MIVLDTTQNYLSTINEIHNYFGGTMISMLVSCAVDHGFQAQSGLTEDYKISDFCF